MECEKKNSILKDMKVLFSKFVLAVKLFVLEVTVHRAYKKLKVAYNTAYKIYNKIREAIYHFVVREEGILSVKVEIDASYFG